MKIKLLLLTILLGSQGFLFGMGGPGATRVNIAGATPVTQRRVPTLFEQSLQALEMNLEQKILRAEYTDLVKEVEKLPGDLIYPLILRMALRNKNLSVADKLNLLGALVFYGKEAHLKNFKRVFNKLRTVLSSGIFPMAFKGDLTGKYFTKEVDILGDRFPLSQTLLHNAIINGDIQLIKLLVAAGSDINAKIGIVKRPFVLSNLTPLHLAIVFENIPLIKFLLEHGADVNKSGRVDEATPLELAIRNSDKEIVKLLLSAGADVNKGSLLWIALGRDDDIVKTLIAAGINVDQLIPNPSYYNVLEWAIMASFADESVNVKLARLLLEAGAKVNTRIDRQGSRVLDYAIGGNEEMIKLLKEYGAKRGSE